MCLGSKKAHKLVFHGQMIPPALNLYTSTSLEDPRALTSPTHITQVLQEQWQTVGVIW